MIKIDMDPPIWVLNINGQDVKMDTEALLENKKFRKVIANTLNILIPSCKPSEHDDIIGPIMATALTVEPADEVTPTGKVLSTF